MTGDIKSSQIIMAPNHDCTKLSVVCRSSLLFDVFWNWDGCPHFWQLYFPYASRWDERLWSRRTRTVRSLARSLAYSTLLVLIACFAALIRSMLALSRFWAHGKEIFVHEMSVWISYLLHSLCVRPNQLILFTKTNSPRQLPRATLYLTFFFLFIGKKISSVFSYCYLVHFSIPYRVRHLRIGHCSFFEKKIKDLIFLPGLACFCYYL